MHYSTGTNLKMMLYTHHEISMRDEIPWIVALLLRLQRVRITFMHYSTGTNLEMLLTTHHEISMRDEHPWTVALFTALATSAHYFHALFNRNKLGNVADHAS